MSRNIIGKTGARQAPDLTSIGQGAFTRREGQRVRTAPRSAAYLRALRLADPGNMSTVVDLQPVYDAIAEEFGPSGSAIPQAVLARCYLGDPFEVHALDIDRKILEHYESYTTVPDGNDTYRNLALHPDYAVVEIYTDRVACIRTDGTVTELSR